MKKKLPIVIIQWDDAASNNGWHNLEDAETKFRVVTTGMLLETTAKNYIVTQSKCLDYDKVGDSITIPKAYVTKKTIMGYVQL